MLTHFGRAFTRLSSIRGLIISMVIGALFATSGCRETFRVYSEATPHFPETWEERLKRKKTTRRASKRAQPKVVRERDRSPRRAEPRPDLAPPRFEGKTERIAVLELMNRAPQLVSRDEVAYLTNELRTVASYLPSPKYLVLTQESLEALIDPSKSIEDCVGSCAVETGRLVGARWILTGQVVRFGSSLRVSLKLHDTKSGQFLKGAAVKGESVEDLERELHVQALSLTKEVAPKWGRWLDQVAPQDLEAQLKRLRMRTN